jgi:hypothetical protein
MPKMRAVDVLRQVQEITATLIKLSLCNEQTFPSIRDIGNGLQSVTFAGANAITTALKTIRYSEVYKVLDKGKAYNFKMLDGALVQLQFEVLNDSISRHRLAFFPTPELPPYESVPESYELDELYAEILSEAIVSLPVRFDFDNGQERHVDVDHPKSHMTLGQYRSCRIPVSSPLTPYDFVSFLLRNFYNPAYKKFRAQLAWPVGRLPQSITQAEIGVPHMRMPNGAIGIAA